MNPTDFMLTVSLLFFLTVHSVLLHRFYRGAPKPRAHTQPEFLLVLVTPHLNAESKLLLEQLKMKKISNRMLGFVVSLAALTANNALAAVDGAITLVSSDPNVLAITPLGGNLFQVDVVGVGHATLTASGDADLGAGVRPVSKSQDYEVYDAGEEADHFELTEMSHTYKTVAVSTAETDAQSDSAASAGDETASQNADAAASDGEAASADPVQTSTADPDPTATVNSDQSA